MKEMRKPTYDQFRKLLTEVYDEDFVQRIGETDEDLEDYLSRTDEITYGDYNNNGHLIIWFTDLYCDQKDKAQPDLKYDCDTDEFIEVDELAEYGEGATYVTEKNLHDYIQKSNVPLKYIAVATNTSYTQLYNLDSDIQMKYDEWHPIVECIDNYVEEPMPKKPDYEAFRDVLDEANYQGYSEEKYPNDSDIDNYLNSSDELSYFRCKGDTIIFYAEENGQVVILNMTYDDMKCEEF
uniref:Uncharacterized protein n=1 Tax=Siphoviridae sp. ctnMR5 TaxID=2825658 RepID=A0A8S5U909_9CAUD|nr:MAG TPA: hypothetical protein [Siphoviridae sp. ctnMR5]